MKHLYVILYNLCMIMSSLTRGVTQENVAKRADLNCLSETHGVRQDATETLAVHELFP